ncbi:uncharacterized protein METZ01_LOCUS70897, partial [marine metagenome]
MATLKSVANIHTDIVGVLEELLL